MLVQRQIEGVLRNQSQQYPVITLTGPRQSGKTTLAKMVFPDKEYISLEDLDIREFAKQDPRGFLNKLPDGGIIDEVQRVPDLLSYIQTIVDNKQIMGQFILTGSAQFELLESITQSLAGRTAMLKLLPFSFNELQKISSLSKTDEFLLYGFFPGIHRRHLNPTNAYRNYVETYLERDVRKIKNIHNISLFKKFVHLCAGRVGQIFNKENLANEVGVSQPTIQSWVSVLEASYIVFFLQPFFENFNKRVIKSPRLYFYDVGLASYLLGIENEKQIERDPLRGALFENLVITELMKYRLNQAKDPQLYFFRDNHGNEVDVLFQYGHSLLPIEIKSASTFNKTLLKGLQYFSKLTGDRVSKAVLAYAGDVEQTVNFINIINYRNISRELRNL